MVVIWHFSQRYVTSTRPSVMGFCSIGFIAASQPGHITTAFDSRNSSMGPHARYAPGNVRHKPYHCRFLRDGLQNSVSSILASNMFGTGRERCSVARGCKSWSGQTKFSATPQPSTEQFIFKTDSGERLQSVTSHCRQRCRSRWRSCGKTNPSSRGRGARPQASAPRRGSGAGGNRAGLSAFDADLRMLSGCGTSRQNDTRCKRWLIPVTIQGL